MPKAERSRPTRKAEQSRETQDRLIKVAKELFTSNGYAGTAMEDLVAKAGMTVDKDITITPAGDAVVLMGNIEKGIYDAGMQNSPIFERAIQRGAAASVLDLYKGEGPQPGINLIGTGSPGARKTFAEKNADVINAYLAALQEALDFANKRENQPAITELIAKELKVEPATLQRPTETFFSSVAKTVKFSRAQWDVSVDCMKLNGLIPGDVPSYEDGVFAGARA